MKFLALVTLFLTFNAFSKTLDINLKAVDSVKINCPAGLQLEMKDNMGKCVCPAGKWGRLEGQELKCDSLCEIKIVEEEFKIYDNCDQCWNGDNVIGVETQKIIKLIKNGDQILYSDRVYSPRQSELEMLIAEATARSEGQCDVVVYKGKVIKD